ncbi:hypothetical protein TTHERM_001156839 (macronuclear) [Tetrahymena thermophila SB210]|uniref:Uncharacterized protein n=1 Tax=Tetrahymena thermophila (strain SB210) TaxID=312017 RepID=W7X8A1_TETTS|nr:hypothetical protein TTHERM_001156839 [Tetrahymena thermophila SB210]EWS72633.1 hypothetical protein TTHERM_001156839 [Tetrahymena thermophila SB210]|eukprot:XP_012654831.1 hypothetical protein TTHERM_001156839 [Tetrahymena thermophila SB210]
MEFKISFYFKTKQNQITNLKLFKHKKINIYIDQCMHNTVTRNTNKQTDKQITNLLKYQPNLIIVNNQINYLQKLTTIYINNFKYFNKKLTNQLKNNKQTNNNQLLIFIPWTDLTLNMFYIYYLQLKLTNSLTNQLVFKVYQQTFQIHLFQYQIKIFIHNLLLKLQSINFINLQDQITHTIIF